jgi:hypothetical protein
VPKSPKRLKRLIVDCDTGQFLAPEGKWTPNEGEALEFSDTTSAIVACGALGIKTAQVLLRFGKTRQPLCDPRSFWRNVLICPGSSV